MSWIFRKPEHLPPPPPPCLSHPHLCYFWQVHFDMRGCSCSFHLIYFSVQLLKLPPIFTEIYIAESLIREYKTVLSPDTLSITEYNENFIKDMNILLESYRAQGREEHFLPDMKLLVEAYRTAGYSELFIQSLEALVRSLMANGRWQRTSFVGNYALIIGFPGDRPPGFCFQDQTKAH